MGLGLQGLGFIGSRVDCRALVLELLSEPNEQRDVDRLQADLNRMRTGRRARRTKAIIASKGNNLRALSGEDLATAVETIRAFSDADLNVAKAAQRMHVHPNTVRYRLQQIATKTGHDPRTFTGLVELLCILEITDTDQQP